MNTSIESRETIKVPIKALKGHLNGTTLELTKEANTSYEYKSIDLSRYNFLFRGVDAEGFLNVEILPIDASPQEEDEEVWKTMKQSPDFHSTQFNPRRRRLHGNVPIPPGYTPYLEVRTKLGGAHKVYVNHRKNFLIKVETYRGGSRLHNLGELGDPKSWIARFKAKFEEWHDWKTKDEIKDEIYKARMYDSQKLATGLLILEKEGVIKKNKDSYAAVNLTIDTPSDGDLVTAHPKKKKLSANKQDEKENV